MPIVFLLYLLFSFSLSGLAAWRGAWVGDDTLISVVFGWFAYVAIQKTYR